MAKNSPDERIVYLAFKDIFVGPDAELRSAKKIRTLVQKHFNSRDQDVRRLVDAYNIDVVVNTVKSLLQEGIFSSTLRAKIRFPEVFEVSPVQSAEREVAESEAARSDEDAIRDAVEGMLESKVTTQVQNLDQPHQGKSKAIGMFYNLLVSVLSNQNKTRSLKILDRSQNDLYPMWLLYTLSICPTLHNTSCSQRYKPY